MPVFIFPLAFIGLLAVPALIAIYWLRNRAREHRVSSLLLWLDEKQVWEGGRRIERLQLPWLFFLELLLILLLLTAAAGPLIRSGDAPTPLIIVLDDSFSMLAGGEGSARNRAARAIENELHASRYDSVRVILAGEAPQLLGESTSEPDQAIKLLKGWQCGELTADLERALPFALELGRNRARLLVITDHAPAQELTGGKIQWWAFGTSQPNMAFVNASRIGYENEERILLEITNLSSRSSQTELRIDSYDSSGQSSGQSSGHPSGLTDAGSALRDPQSLSLGPHETRRIALSIKAVSAPLRARLSDDALGIDNEVLLLPEASKRARVDLRVQNAMLRPIVEKALGALQDVSITAERAQLLISDEADAKFEDPDSWVLHLISEPDAASYLGPFVVDRLHPLSEGLSLGGVVWSSGKSMQFPGTPVITAGNVPLLTDIERAGRHELRLRLRPDLSTLQQTPNWPILIWNLIQWRVLSAPGVRQTNVRLGSEVTLKVETGVESVKLIDPQRNEKQLPVHDGAVIARMGMIGLFQFNAGQNRYSVAANALRREESDLSGAATGRWGDWVTATESQRDYHSVAWILLLLSMIVLAAQAWLASSRGRRRERENAKHAK